MSEHLLAGSLSDPGSTVGSIQQHELRPVLAASGGPVINTKQSNGNKQAPPPPAKMVGYFELFRFATKRDVVMNVIGTIGAVCAGAVLVILSNFVFYLFNLRA